MDNPPTGGNFLVYAADGNNLAVLTANGNVDMAVDSKGNGNLEGHVTNPWPVFD